MSLKPTAEPSPQTSHESAAAPPPQAQSVASDGRKRPARALHMRNLLVLTIALALNLLLGEWTASRFDLPLVLDHTGSVLAGLLLGPVAGGMVGAVSVIPAVLLGESAPLLAFFTALLPAIWVGWMAGAARGRDGRRAPLRLIGGALAAAVGAALLSTVLAAAPQGGQDFGAAFVESVRSGMQSLATIAGAAALFGGPLLSFVLGSLLAWPLTHRFGSATDDEAVVSSALGRAALGWLLALTAGWYLLPLLGRPLLALFFLPVLLSVWRLPPPAGARAGLLATALGALAGPLLIVPPVGRGPLLATDWLWMALFLTVALYIVFVTDLLKRRTHSMAAAAASHRQADARLAALAAGVDESLLLIAPDRTISLANARLQELFAQRVADLQGHTLDEAEPLLTRAFADPATFSHFVAETLSEPTGDASGLLEQEWPVARELAIRTLPVQGRDEYFGRLYLLRDRTHERETEQLYTRIVGVLSDDLRAPALRIRALATTLIEGGGGDLSDTHLRLLTTLRAHAEHQLTFLNLLNEAARLESEQVHLSFAPVDLAALIQEVAAQMRPLLHEKKQTLTVDTAADLPAIEADASRVTQALTNLISNAHKFNALGGWVRVEAKRESSVLGKRVRVAVSDGGFGISSADQKRLGERFFRIVNDQTRGLSGTGLGLTLVTAIVRLHGGELEIDSAPGRGSTFALLLPFAQPETVPVAAPPADEADSVAPALELAPAPEPGRPAAPGEDDGIALGDLPVAEVVEAEITPTAPQPVISPEESQAPAAESDHARLAAAMVAAMSQSRVPEEAVQETGASEGDGSPVAPEALSDEIPAAAEPPSETELAVSELLDFVVEPAAEGAPTAMASGESPVAKDEAAVETEAAVEAEAAAPAPAETEAEPVVQVEVEPAPEQSPAPVDVPAPEGETPDSSVVSFPAYDPLEDFPHEPEGAATLPGDPAEAPQPPPAEATGEDPLEGPHEKLE